MKASETTLTALPEVDRLMLQKKYASPIFGNLEPGMMLMVAKALMLKVHVITGWNIPPGADLITVLTDQFSKLLQEDYPDMNSDEVEYAFRRSGTAIEDWGKSMNLNLIEKVLVPYRNQRFRLSQEVEAPAKSAPRQVPKWEAECNWAYYQLSLIDKLPCKIVKP